MSRMPPLDLSLLSTSDSSMQLQDYSYHYTLEALTGEKLFSQDSPGARDPTLTESFQHAGGEESTYDAKSNNIF